MELSCSPEEPEFQRWLRVMDIDARDLQQLFSIVDEDSSGEIDPREFIEAMYRMRTADSKTAIKFVKHIVSRIDAQQKNLQVKFETYGASEANTPVSNDIQELSDKLDKMVNVLTGMGVHSGIHELNGKFDKTFGALPDMGKFEGQLQAVLLQQEQHIRETIEAALRKAAEVALDAAKWATTGTTPSIGVAGDGHHESMVPLPINQMPPAVIHEGELAPPQKQVVSLVGPPGPSGCSFARSKAISEVPQHDDVPSQATPQPDDQARGSQPNVRFWSAPSKARFAS